MTANAEVDLFTAPTYADLRLAMMQVGDDDFTVTALGVELDCDCIQEPEQHSPLPAAWVQAVEDHDPADPVNIDDAWWNARVHDAVRRELEAELQEVLHPVTAEALRQGVEDAKVWDAENGGLLGL